MIEKGFVKIERKITKWRWYQDTATFKLFIHLILTANYEDRDFENITVKRGQRVASIRTLAAESGLTEKNVRTAIKHLKETQEVAQSATPKYSVFTIVNYEKYQMMAHQVANKRRTGGEQVANRWQQCKKDKKDKNIPVSKDTGIEKKDPGAPFVNGRKDF